MVKPPFVRWWTAVFTLFSPAPPLTPGVPPSFSSLSEIFQMSNTESFADACRPPNFRFRRFFRIYVLPLCVFRNAFFFPLIRLSSKPLFFLLGRAPHPLVFTSSMVCRDLSLRSSYSAASTVVGGLPFRRRGSRVDFFSPSLDESITSSL